MSEQTAEETVLKNRRKLPHKFKILFLVMTVLFCFFLYHARSVGVKKQQLVKKIQSMNGHVQYSYLKTGIRFIDSRINRWSQSKLFGPIFKRVRGISLFSPSFEDSDFLGELEIFSSLKSLQVFNSKIKDATPLKNFTDLETLALASPYITDISSLSGLVNLENLHLMNSRCQDLSPLKNLLKLQYLKITLESVEDLSAIGELTQLENLTIYYCQGKNLEPLENLKKLQKLSFIRSPGVNFQFLRHYPELTSLSINQSQINDLSFLSGMTALERLYLPENKIRDLAPLYKLEKLVDLDVRYNPGLTLEEIKKFQEKLPDCKVHHNLE